MRKVAVCLSVLLIAVMSMAIAEEMKEKGKTHDVMTVVVAVDMEGKTITVKGDDGDMTMPVMEEAASALGNLKQGDKVTLTCTDDAEGHHKGITKIMKSEA